MKVVEEDGQFLWPRHQRADGKWFGFDKQILSRIRAQYLDKSQFFAQYYNDPSDPVNKRVTNFQYYDREHVKMFEGRWTINGKPLNVYAAIDFAASLSAKADYTAIVVIGVDYDHTIYVLDIDRFRTNKISEMAERLEKLYGKWRWIRLRAEINAQQGLIVEQIKDYNRKRGVYYSIDNINQNINKQIRIMANLEPRYAEGAILHFHGGFCQVLEDELTSSKPPHDDTADALASCVEIATAPSRRAAEKKVANITFHPKWGGIR
jgi:predicted phage terminase large subunit-like protein